MTILTTPQKLRVGSQSRKATLAASAATLVLAMVAFPMTAQAQVVIDVVDCADLPVDNPAGATVNINTNAECTVDNGDVVELEDDTNDDSTINIAAGTTLISTDGDDEDVVIFVDNSEDRTIINIAEGATLQGENGVIFLEGDQTTLVNNGTIINVGEADEGALYIDRDTDSSQNTITNTGTITSTGGGHTIGLDALLDTTTVTLDNSGTISNTNIDDSDSDAINFNGDPGTTGGEARGCLENSGADVLCSFQIDFTNSGTISTARDNGSNAGIRIEQDAVVAGTITNTVDGVIIGARTGINVNGAHSDHDLTIANSGRIEGTSGDGIYISGAGVTINNAAGGVIIGGDAGVQLEGTSITVDIGPSDETLDVAAIGNTFVNAGTISGTRASFDASGAGEAITFEQQGGALTGNFLGSTGFTDNLNFTTADFTLTHDILQSVNVGVASGVSLSFDGARTIDGNLTSNGDLAFDLGDDALTVTGDVLLNTDSTVTVSDTGAVAAIDQQFTLIDVGGTLTNNATLVPQIDDTSFLLDFVAVADASGDLVVAVTAAGGTEEEEEEEAEEEVVEEEETEEEVAPTIALDFTDPNLSTFGDSVLSAFNSGNLDNTAAFSALAALATQGEVEDEVRRLIPDVTNAAQQEVFGVIGATGSIIDQRLSNLNRTAASDYSYQTASTDGMVKGTNAYVSARNGAWLQGGFRNASLDSPRSDVTENAGYDSGSYNLAVGYDWAVTPNTIIGVSGGLSQVEVDTDRTASDNLEIDLSQVTLYGSHRAGAFEFNGQIGYATGEASASRQAFETISSDYDLTALNIQGLAQYFIQLDNSVYVAPLAGLQYVDVTADAHTETGGLNIAFEERTGDFLEGRVGVKLGKQSRNADSTADYYVAASIVNDFGEGASNLNFSYANQAVSLEAFDAPDTRVNGRVGYNWWSADAVSVGLLLEGELGEDYGSVGGNVRLKYAF